MGNLFKYASLTTKIRSMSGDLIGLDGLKHLCECETISDTLSELMNYKYYRNAFKNKDISALHRADIEQILLLSNMEEFAGLYRFSSGIPRQYLNLVAMYNEMYLLKRILRDILSHRPASLDLKAYSDYISAHIDIDIEAAHSANDIAQFMEAIKNTVYYDCLYKVFSKGESGIFDYVLALDSHYFEICFKFAGKVLKGSERREILSILGLRCDFVNMQWIYRTKKYYKVSNTSLVATLIPHYYKLSTGEIKEMTEAQTVEDFNNTLSNTYYGKIAPKLFTSMPGLEEFYMTMLEYMYNKNKRNNPYSLSSLSCYLYFRELEISRVVEIIESIRYSLPAADIITKILKLETRRSFA